MGLHLRDTSLPKTLWKGRRQTGYPRTMLIKMGHLMLNQTCLSTRHWARPRFSNLLERMVSTIGLCLAGDRVASLNIWMKILDGMGDKRIHLTIQQRPLVERHLQRMKAQKKSCERNNPCVLNHIFSGLLNTFGEFFVLGTRGTPKHHTLDTAYSADERVILE